MTDDPRKFLKDMKLAAEFVVSAMADRQREDLRQDMMLRFAVERQLITVGEALNQLHHAAPEVAERIDQWRNVIGFRNILVHGYDVLDDEIIWDISTQKVPLLIEQLTKLLSEQ